MFECMCGDVCMQYVHMCMLFEYVRICLFVCLEKICISRILICLGSCTKEGSPRTT